jgi:hypothetical protein
LELRGSRVSARGHAALESAFGKSQVPWSEPNRTAAEAVLAAGGAVRVRVQGGERELDVRTARELPEGYFRVTGFRLTGTAKPQADFPEKVAALGDVEFDGLTAVDLAGVGFGADPLDALLKALPGTVAELSLARTSAGDGEMAVCAKSLRGLRRLDLTGTRVTPAGVSALQRELPDCRITGPM